MKQLIYVSKPTQEVNPQMVNDILETSYKMNFDNGINGMLVCDGEYFLQCIEGDEEAVDQLYSNICNDKRHDEIKLIGTMQIDQKDFKDWEMAYIDNRKDVVNMIKELTSKNDFIPYEFTFSEAITVLKGLRSLI